MNSVDRITDQLSNIFQELNGDERGGFHIVQVGSMSGF